MFCQSVVSHSTWDPISRQFDVVAGLQLRRPDVSRPQKHPRAPPRDPGHLARRARHRQLAFLLTITASRTGARTLVTSTRAPAAVLEHPRAPPRDPGRPERRARHRQLAFLLTIPASRTGARTSVTSTRAPAAELGHPRAPPRDPGHLARRARHRQLAFLLTIPASRTGGALRSPPPGPPRPCSSTRERHRVTLGTSRVVPGTASSPSSLRFQRHEPAPHVGHLHPGPRGRARPPAGATA